MSEDVVIRAEGLGKKYMIRRAAGAGESYRVLRDVMAQSAMRFLRSGGGLLSGRYPDGGGQEEAFWALRDINFEIRRGDVVGIMGRNGAGKSTLLKILSRITEPSEGRVTLEGRVASLLEVGTGFHPELTGRENIYLNGALLGMMRAEIHRKFDEIVAFAEVERFLDMPVKRYSSGMYVRLAFAVAAHLEPEILVVDEVLAVGDAEFQKKCLGKMQDVAGHGRTVLFVSHQLGMVSTLCTSGVLLSGGQVAAKGDIVRIIDIYQNAMAVASDNELRNARPREHGEPLAILAARTMCADGSVSSQFAHTEPVVLDIEIGQYAPVGGEIFITAALVDSLARRVFTDEHPLRPLLASNCFEVRSIRLQAVIPMPLLVASHYSFILTINSPEGRVFDRHDGVCGFSVVDRGSRMAKYEGWAIGPLMSPLSWKVLEQSTLPLENAS